jgi:GGDEF domain-containing protein
MSAESNIILITDNKNVVDILKPKLVLLREIDNILTTTYAEAMTNLQAVVPDVILIYCASEKQACLELIKNIKTNEKTKSISVLLLVEEYEQDFILNAYDENVDDYLNANADDAEILIRTIWGLKKTAYISAIQKQKSLLESLSVIDKNTGFYTNEYCEKIFENEFKSLEKNNDEGILMLVSASEESKTKLNVLQLAKAIKISIRNSDVVVHSSANRFFVLLRETQLKGAFTVWDKIKRAVGEQYKINAGISQINGKHFDELQKELLNALVEATSTNQDLVIVSDEQKETLSGDWLEKINSTQKNFKLFKQAFNKKLEKVITPIFFQIQKMYEDKLFKTQIEQYSNETLSAFVLKSENKLGELKITYPGFSKINIDIIHQGLDSPENKRINLDLTELDETRLTQILEEFIAEFKNN